MNQHVKAIFQKAQALTPAEREELAELLLATVEAQQDFDRDWADEAARRWDEHNRSGVGATDAFQAVDEARANLKRSS